jgi:RNA polymerase sigma-70 factor (ECF subfamily)
MVDDLVQETFLAVFRSAASYADGASVKTWLFAVGANVARDRVRKASRLSLLRARFARWQSGVESRGPERLMQQTEAVRALAAAMAELPADLRTAFVMCDVEQLPGVEVAAALELPTGTLYRRLRGEKRIRSDGRHDVPASESAMLRLRDVRLVRARTESSSVGRVAAVNALPVEARVPAPAAGGSGSSGVSGVRRAAGAAPRRSRHRAESCIAQWFITGGCRAALLARNPTNRAHSEEMTSKSPSSQR